MTGHGRRSVKRVLFIDHYERWVIQVTGERIAREIEATVEGPEKFCEDMVCLARARFLQGTADAAVARRDREPA